jgi:hypothetical protein
LLNHLDVRISITNGAIISPIVRRFAGDRIPAGAWTWATGIGIANLKIRTAAAIDPDAAAVPTPGLTLDAGRVAVLFYHCDATARIGWAELPASILRGTVNRLRGGLVRESAPAQREHRENYELNFH